MSRQPQSPNEQLRSCLDELGWSPKTLARKINKTFGDGSVAESAPYHWRDQGGLPRAPLPTVVAHVLSQALGRVVSVEFLWQGRTSASSAFVPAETDLARPWTASDLGGILEGWVSSGLIDRRHFLAASGASLTAIVTHFLEGTEGRGAFTARLAGQRHADPLVTQVEQNLPLLQQLDDEHGGARHLSYVGAQFRAVALLLHEGGHATQTQIRLLQALGEVGQLAGWMAFDAGEHGLAQRYFATALRAAHQVNDDALAAHILADLSFQAASRHHPTDAVALGQAAARTSRSATPGVRGTVLSRLAFAYANAGQAADFERTRDQARQLVDSAGDGSAEPRWMYFLTANHLDCQAGYGLVQLGRAADTPTARVKRHLSAGNQLLETGAHAVPKHDPSQRRALFEGAWLALGYTAVGEIEQACSVADRAVTRLESVASPRSVALLHELTGDLRRRQRNPHVRDFLPRLEAALAERSKPRTTSG
ncbi:hypothetical protein ABH940_007358 [Streptacidiphilus sp. BW17]